ncbi:MAG: hypothetical protein IJ410_00595 [Oscillospiraceae bacterium]|nr:hypothetical protein [Oscillospiraceae bacterium]
MNNFFRIAGVLCLCGYVTGILTYFIPINQTEKSVRLVIILYIISVAFNQELNLPSFSGIDFPDETQISAEADSYVIEMAEENLENTVKERLSEKNISYTELDVHINKQTDKLFIDKIYIYGADNINIEKAKSALSDILSQESIISGDIYVTE